MALLLGAALAGYPLLGADRSTPGLVVLAAFALAAIALSLLWIPLPGPVLIGLAAEFLVRELDTDVDAASTIAYGTGLLLLCELFAWASALRSPALVSPAVVVRRTLNLGLVALVGAAAAGVALAAGSAESPNAFLSGLSGAAAVAGLVALVWSLGRRST